ncbi:MAG: TadA family conjugal transfer-associated ATPase [Nocardiaceae bacterium]|nr:TadA family conjugal transfer-associated ATPase [Nocardiaceae bacterium]
MTVVTDDLLDRVRDRLVTLAERPTPSTVAAAIRAEAGSVLADADMLRTLRKLETELSGAGPLEELLAAPDVTDVLVCGPSDVWIDRGEGLVRAAVSFPDEAAVRRLAQRLAISCGRRIDDSQPWVDGFLPPTVGARFGVRLHAVLAPIAASGTCISLRVLRPAQHSLATLVTSGSLCAASAELLRRIVIGRLTWLVTGGTGSGKTTILSSMLTEVDARERIVCVEDAAELDPLHPHVVRLVSRISNTEGAGAIGVRDLVRQALRMRPDRVVVGEVRGAEVIDLLGALNTGHEGGAGTVHANSPAELPARLEALAALGGMDRTALHSQLAAAVRVVVHMDRRPDGTRRLAEIGVVDRDGSPLVAVVPAWTADGGAGVGMPRLERLLRGGR